MKSNSIFYAYGNLVVTLEDGTVFQRSNVDDETFLKIKANLDNKEALFKLFNPGYTEQKEFIDNLDKSNHLVRRGDSIYLEEISQLTVPENFAKKFLEAELNGDDDKVIAYLNFWTLLSLNPDSRVRNNLFWFLDKWGMCISKSGLVVGYRNADIEKEGIQFNQELVKFVSTAYYVYDGYCDDILVIKQDGEYVCGYKDEANQDDLILGKLSDLYHTICEDENDLTATYTDHHSHTFRIKLGHVVSMPREKCDSDQEHTCSSGLHVGAKGWLKENYFGSVGLKVLVNPADVVGIPTLDDYGKMRTCAYYPISIIDFDENGDIVDDGIESGFEDDFIDKICYSGDINNDDLDNYTITVPMISEIDRDNMFRRLKQLAESRYE